VEAEEGSRGRKEEEIGGNVGKKGEKLWLVLNSEPPTKKQFFISYRPTLNIVGITLYL